MRMTVLALLVPVLWLAAPPAEAGAVKQPPRRSRAVLYEQMRLDQIEALLRQRGLRPEVLRLPGSNTAVRFELAERPVLLVLGDRGAGVGRDMYLYMGIRLDRAVPLERINTWNQGARFCRAYLDAEGDPVIESDLRLTGGVTPEGFYDWLDTFALALTRFQEHVLLF